MALQEEFEKQGAWLFRYRGVLPLAILFAGAIFYIDTIINPDTLFLDKLYNTNYFGNICLLISLFGLFIRVYTVGHTPRNTSGRNVKGQLADTLNTTGSYSVVRHPLYLGNFFLWLGPALLTGNLWFIIVFFFLFWVYYERIMFTEEHFLKAQFGKSYSDWSSKTPAFIPRLKSFVKPDLPFSWRKVLKKEKNGFAAIFLIFCTFNVTAEIIENENNYNTPLIFASVFSVLLYFILKFLKTRTDLLNETDR